MRLLFPRILAAAGISAVASVGGAADGGADGPKSCDVQLSNLLDPTPENLETNTNLYLQDLAEYSEDPLGFLTGRAESCGGGSMNFASLGKLIVGEHEDVAKIIQMPQVRGAFLGRLRIDMERLPPYFFLSLSDPGTDTEDGETGVHQILHDFVWSDLIAWAQAQSATEEVKAVLASYVDRLISELVEQSGGIDGELDPAVTKKLSEEFTCRYMMKALFGLDVDDATVAQLQELWQTPGYSLVALMDPSPITPEQYAGIEQATEQLSLLIQSSPSLADYVPSDANFNLSRKEWADELVPVIGIAALHGGRNLVDNLFTKIPSDYHIDESKHDEIAAAVLEAGRIRAPVNNINVILQEPTAFSIGGEPTTFPPGTVVAASLGLGSVDPKVFPDPETFDHTRDNLMTQIVNYNSVGYSPSDVGVRVCPGRNVALKMASEVLTAWLLRRKPTAEDATENLGAEGADEIIADNPSDVGPEEPAETSPAPARFAGTVHCFTFATTMAALVLNVFATL